MLGTNHLFSFVSQFVAPSHVFSVVVVVLVVIVIISIIIIYRIGVARRALGMPDKHHTIGLYP